MSLLLLLSVANYCTRTRNRTAAGEIKDRPGTDRIRELSVAPLLAEAIYRVHKSMPFAELLTWTISVRAKRLLACFLAVRFVAKFWMVAWNEAPYKARVVVAVLQ